MIIPPPPVQGCLLVQLYHLQCLLMVLCKQSVHYVHACVFVGLCPTLINILSTYIFNRRQKCHILLTISMTDESFKTNFDRQQKATAEKTVLSSGHREMNEDAWQTMLWKSIGKQVFLYRRNTGLQRQGQKPDESQDPLLALKVSGFPSSHWFMLHGFCSLFFFKKIVRGELCWIKSPLIRQNERCANKRARTTSWTFSNPSRNGPKAGFFFFDNFW